MKAPKVVACSRSRASAPSRMSMIEPTRNTMPATMYGSSKSSTAATMLSEKPERGQLVRGHGALAQRGDAAAREPARAVGVPGLDSVQAVWAVMAARLVGAPRRASVQRDERSKATDERSRRRARASSSAGRHEEPASVCSEGPPRVTNDARAGDRVEHEVVRGGHDREHDETRGRAPRSRVRRAAAEQHAGGADEQRRRGVQARHRRVRVRECRDEAALIARAAVERVDEALAERGGSRRGGRRGRRCSRRCRSRSR